MLFSNTIKQNSSGVAGVLSLKILFRVLVILINILLVRSFKFCARFPQNLIRMASDTRAPTERNGKIREKVALKPGFHLADWMRLSNSSTNLSGRKEGEGLRKITVAELAEHSSQFDCWTAYNGKVYNISQYLAYHPGGAKQLMLGAGKDCTDLFNKYHRWVNTESILAKCVVGVLLSEAPAIQEYEGDEEEDEEQDSDRKGDAKSSLSQSKGGASSMDGAAKKGSHCKAEGKD
jgi:cytochrome b involved in lipid metabolism